MTFLLDTNVLSELCKPREGNRVAAWVDRQDEESLFLSVISIAEIRRGISLLDTGRRRESLTAWLADDLIQRFAERIHAVDETIALVWGDFLCEARREGRTLSAMDGFIGATAKVKGETLATRNVKDFTGLGIDLLNPWEA